ncbi:MAG: hypothetical protein ACRCUI_00165, partial [Polymorphobacter sp.]
MKFASLAVAAVAAAIVAMPAQAAVYLSQAAFSAANPGLNLTSYTGLAPNNIDFVGSPYTVGGVTATGSNLFTVSTAFWGSVDSLLENSFGTTLTISFAASNAVGFFVAGSYDGDIASNITAYNGTTVVFAGSP